MSKRKKEYFSNKMKFIFNNYIRLNEMNINSLTIKNAFDYIKFYKFNQLYSIFAWQFYISYALFKVLFISNNE